MIDTLSLFISLRLFGFWSITALWFSVYRDYSDARVNPIPQTIPAIAPCLFTLLEKIPINKVGKNDDAANPKAKATVLATIEVYRKVNFQLFYYLGACYLNAQLPLFLRIY